jgi:flagellar biosynthesis/type III secretory pathway chaperone
MLEQSMVLVDCREENTQTSLFKALIEVLKKELLIYQELKNIIILEKKILSKPSLEELNQSNALKENIILKSRMLEEVRTNILKKIGRIFDININAVKLSQIAGYAGKRQREELNEIQKSLALISQEINALNASNKDLLEASMNNIKGSLDFISSIMSAGSVYQESGKMKPTSNNGTYLHTEG